MRPRSIFHRQQLPGRVRPWYLLCYIFAPWRSWKLVLHCSSSFLRASLAPHSSRLVHRPCSRAPPPVVPPPDSPPECSPAIPPVRAPREAIQMPTNDRMFTFSCRLEWQCAASRQVAVRDEVRSPWLIRCLCALARRSLAVRWARRSALRRNLLPPSVAARQRVDRRAQLNEVVDGRAGAGACGTARAACPRRRAGSRGAGRSVRSRFYSSHISPTLSSGASMATSA